MSDQELFDTHYTTQESIKELSKQLNEPEWLLNRRLEAYQIYHSLPYDKDTLFYKYTTFKDFDPSKLNPSWKDATPAEVDLKLGEFEITLYETESGVSSKLPEELINKGVILEEIHSLIERDEEFAKSIIEKVDLASKEFDKLGALARAFASNIVVFYIPKGVTLESPLIHAIYLSNENRAHFSELITIAEEETSATLVRVFHQGNEAASEMYTGMETVFLGDNAEFNTLQIQNWNTETLHVMSRLAKLSPYAKYKSLVHMQGGYLSRHNSQVDLDGNGSEGYDLFIAFGSHKQRFDVKSELHHNGRDTIGQTHSRQVMIDSSDSVLRGLIVIPKEGINADSWLTSRGMTINKGKVTAIPALKIDQNEVKAAHAASVEPLNDELLFYLETRGIEEEIAKEMVIKGYFESIFKIFGNSEILDVSRTMLSDKYDEIRR